MAEKMVSVGDVKLWTEDFGDPGDAPLLLVMGASAPVIHYTEEFCQDLVARGHHVIRFDQRDIGRSTPVDWERAPYDCRDLARDAVAVLDAYGIESAHVMGTSMGGLICQYLALDHRERVRSATLMSTSSALSGVPVALGGGPTHCDPPPLASYVEAFTALVEEMTARPATTREEVIDAQYKLFLLHAGSVRDEERLYQLAVEGFDRAVVPGRPDHHGAAVAASDKDLAPRLRELDLPVLVVHGTEDPIVPVQHGRRLAETIPGAGLLVLDGYGHLAPPHEVFALVAQAIAELTQEV
ncbi:alpha/beta fold hydrolase [Streptomyces sp. NPDC007929]|uniref:alpha/beta fold hydrolase n=1 Tax=unclassified Streptomyces TaxID=2593676 RepID=UPI0036E63762